MKVYTSFKTGTLNVGYNSYEINDYQLEIPENEYPNVAHLKDLYSLEPFPGMGVTPPNPGDTVLSLDEKANTSSLPEEERVSKKKT